MAVPSLRLFTHYGCRRRIYFKVICFILLYGLSSVVCLSVFFCLLCKSPLTVEVDPERSKCLPSKVPVSIWHLMFMLCSSGNYMFSTSFQSNLFQEISPKWTLCRCWTLHFLCRSFNHVERIALSTLATLFAVQTILVRFVSNHFFAWE